jgi:uncharacterized membrane protein
MLPLLAAGVAVVAGLFWLLTLGRPRTKRREALRGLAGTLLVLGLSAVTCDALVLNHQQSAAIHGAAEVTAVIAYVGAALALLAATVVMVTFGATDLAGLVRWTWRSFRRRP